MHQRLFDAVYARSLVYNACWEDPAIDRIALDLSAKDTVLVITSGGCNVLDYALAGAGRVEAVDANPRQTALLELKLAGIRHLEYDDFFALFGEGSHPRFRELYRDSLRADLSPFAQRWWDVRGSWFSGNGWRRGLYFHGLSGLVARLMRTMLATRPRLRRGVDQLLAATTLPEQQAIYDREVAPRLWGPALAWLSSRRTTMSLLGVPWTQARAVEASHSDGIAGFIRSSIEHVLRSLPIWTNYFWTVYLRGAYTRTCCPEYLRPMNFQALKHGLVDRIHPHTGYLTDFMRSTQQPISRFVLLDHMDWMGTWQPHALADEWQALFDCATPGARVIFRSAAPEPTFLDTIAVRPHAGVPAVALPDLLRFNRGLADDLHRLDRVHTYASFHIADLAA